MATARGRGSASAASTFSSHEIEQMLDLARLLPDDWCVAIEPPYGQVVITPRRGYHFAFDTPCALPSGRVGRAHIKGSDLRPVPL